MKIYLAAPLFSTAERNFNANLAAELRGLGHEVFLPQEHYQAGARAIFESDCDGLTRCDVGVALWEGSDPDSGTAWECGWAYASGIPVIGVRTDFRMCGDHGDEPVNLMLTCSAKKVLHLPGASACSVAVAVDEALKACAPSQFCDMTQLGQNGS